MKITQQDIESALVKEPMLDDRGFRQKPKRDQPIEESIPLTLTEVQLCVDWLSVQEILPKVPAKCWSSYGLKHAVEQAGGEYVSNGAFIAACIIMGVPYERSKDSDNPNAACAVKALKSNFKLHGVDPRKVWGEQYNFKPMRKQVAA